MGEWNMTIGEKIKLVLDEKGIQAKDLADEINVSQPTMSYYLNDKRSIDAKTIAKIAEKLNVSTDYLLLDTDVKKIKLTDKEETLLSSFNKMSKEKQDAFLKLIELEHKK